MVSNIMDLFRTTNKGIYNMTELPATTSLSKSFFGLSVGLEIVYMLVFIGIFGLSVFRSVKKIKNPKFKTQKDDDVNNQEEAENVEDQTNAKQTNDNLIYRFDEQDHQKEKKGEGEEDQKKEGEENAQQNSQDEYDKDHDENQERFLEIDNQLLFLQPFLIGHIVCNNLFATGYITLILVVVSLLLFFIFNIKGACANVKWLSLLFMLPAIGSFVPIFLSDLDMST